MAAYTNLDGGLQKFYFAQIEKVHAGKTMVDPPVRSGRGERQRLPADPQPGREHLPLPDVRLDVGRRPQQTGVSQIQTAVNGAAQFNNREITITIPLPADYGEDGLNPPGDITDEEGWWLIEYNVNQGNDTTTWARRHPRQPGPPGAAVMGRRGSDPGYTPRTPRPDPGTRFVIGITVAVVAFAALVAFAMYWLAPLQ